MKRAVVCGAGGFLGSHMVRRLKAEGYFVRGLSRTQPRYWKTEADEYWTCDLRQWHESLYNGFDEIYNFAGEVGGLGFIMDCANDATMLRNSTLIDINVLDACRAAKVPKLFFSSSACVYGHPKRSFAEHDAYPFEPINEFAWQKLFAERLYQAYAEDYGMNIKIARLFNTYGEGMTWQGGREKSVAALCRKIAQAKDGDIIEIWGSGEQMRSYTYVDDAIEGIRRLMNSDEQGPINLGCAEEVSIRDLIKAISDISGKMVFQTYTDGPTGMPRICADTTLLKAVLNWEPQTSLREGLKTVYPWVKEQVDKAKEAA